MSDDRRVEVMKVQKVCLPEQDYVSWVVLDDDYLIIEPIAAFLSFYENIGRSPNTIRSSAHHLKLFWEFLREKQVEWTEVDVAHLAAFVGWLRNQNPTLLSLEQKPAARTDATIDQMLTAVHSFYDFQMRMKTVPDLPLYRFLMMPNRRYKPFLYGIAKVKQLVPAVTQKQVPLVMPTATTATAAMPTIASARARLYGATSARSWARALRASRSTDGAGVSAATRCRTPSAVWSRERAETSSGLASISSRMKLSRSTNPSAGSSARARSKTPTNEGCTRP